jgi:hypothetical protein
MELLSKLFNSGAPQKSGRINLIEPRPEEVVLEIIQKWIFQLVK